MHNKVTEFKCKENKTKIEEILTLKLQSQQEIRELNRLRVSALVCSVSLESLGSSLDLPSEPMNCQKFINDRTKNNLSLKQ